MRAWLALVLLVVAGCMEPTPDPIPEATDCEDHRMDHPVSDAGFDGETALAWVEQIVYDGDGLRPRSPGLEGHDCTAALLAEAMNVTGWDVTVDRFSAQEYVELDKGAAQPWTSPSDCEVQDIEELPTFIFHNLIAVKPGTDARTLLLAAHWDAKENASDGGIVPAANDGASGMGILLEMQRALADIELPYTVAIAFFDGEDGFEDCHPLAGSIHFASTMPVRVDRMILLDMVGDIDARFPRESYSRSSDPALQGLIWERADAHGLGEQFTDTVRAVVDDHRPFIDAGIPAVDIIDYDRPGTFFPPYWHTSQDTPDKLSADMMDAMGALLLDVMQHPDFVADWP